MTVELMWVTPDGDKLIAEMARVSNPGGQQNHETAPKLISYLIKHSHWSPFEMVNMCVQIKTTRDIGRQILRHRSFSFQEFSQRYASIEALGDMIPRECRMQDAKNRQSSNTCEDDMVAEAFIDDQYAVWKLATEAYTQALAYGVAKEQARALLPEGLTPTTMYMNGTLRSWIHFLKQRLYPGAQKEIQLIAQEVHELISHEFPMVYEAVSGYVYGEEARL